MEFNEKWTKEINDEYRQMIKDGKSVDEILEEFKEVSQFHPKGKFKRGLMTFENYINLINEIKFNPNYVYFTFNYEQSLRFKDGKDIIFYFNVNDIDYILKLEFLIENNEYFHNQIFYNIFFTTKKQYDEYLYFIKNEKDISKLENMYLELQELVEKETNRNDVIKIFNSISYILLKASNHIKDPIFALTETTRPEKINFYNKSIQDSFKDKYELKIGKSQYFDGKTYYYIIKK